MSMRRNLIWCLALAMTTALCVAGIASAADTGNNVSTVTQKIKPTSGKLSAKTQKPIKLFVWLKNVWYIVTALVLVPLWSISEYAGL